MEDCMSRKIYKLCLIRGFTEAYYQLSEEARNHFWEQASKAIEASGASMQGPYYDCRWSNDKYYLWFTMTYADIDAAIADTHGVEKAGMFRYLVSETIMGIEAEGDPSAV
jgi:hypothetical protein